MAGHAWKTFILHITEKLQTRVIATYLCIPLIHSSTRQSGMQTLVIIPLGEDKSNIKILKACCMSQYGNGNA